MVPKTTKTSGKSAKQGAKARGSAKPVRKSPAKPARKPAGAAPGKKASKPAKPAGSKAPAKKSAAPKAAAKPAAKKPVAAKPAPAKAKTAGKPKAAATRPAAVRVVSPAPRHPQRKPEPAAAAAKSASAAKPVAAEPAAVARPMVAARPMPPAKRPFSRESVRVGEARHAQPAGSRPVFPPEFLERQRERLQVKKQEILAMYQKDLKSGQESNDSPTEDLVDRANNAYTRELAFSISDSERELMQQIDLAIERLKAGSYGFCLHTGQQIGQARLEAIPWAKYSVEAQELLEKGLLSEA